MMAGGEGGRGADWHDRLRHSAASMEEARLACLGEDGTQGIRIRHFCCSRDIDIPFMSRPPAIEGSSDCH